MKKTALKDALRNILKRFVSWLSMVTIVLIGTSVILGLFFSYRSLSVYGNNYVKRYNGKDMDVACSVGVRDQEVERILQVEGVRDAEGFISFTGEIATDTRSSGATLISATERISTPYIIEGRMPEKGNECALNPELAKSLNASIGDTVVITASVSRLANTLTNQEYIVTGTMEHPDYITRAMTTYCILPMTAFDTSGASFDYTNIAIDLDESDSLAPISDKLSKEINTVRNRIDAISDDMGRERMADLAGELDREYEKIEAQAMAKLADAKSQIDSAQKEFDDKIGDAQKKLDDAEKELNDGKAKAERELAAGWKKIQDGENEYNTKIADAERQLAEGEKQMEDELANARWLLFDGMLQIDNNEKLLNEKEAEYQQALESYNKGEEKLKAGREELDEGWKKVNDGLDLIDRNLPKSDIEEIADAFAEIPEEEFQEVAKALYSVADRPPLERAEGLLDVYDHCIDWTGKEDIKELLEKYAGIGEIRSKLHQLRDGISTLESKEEEYKDGLRRLENAKEELEEGRLKLDSGWFALNEAKVKLADGEAELARKEPEARAQLAAKKAEYEQQKADGAKQLEDAKNTYAAKKKQAMDEIAVHEKELADGKEQFEKERAENQEKLDAAWDEYNKGKKDAEDKLAEVKREIENGKSTECKWFVQTLDANLYFLEFKSYCQVLSKVFMVFTPIYAIIVVLVCFFTMAIIVEEQSKQIGTCKALGMYKSEIRRKYSLFGITAALFGALIGIGGGFFFEKIIGNSLKTVFVFGAPPHQLDIIPLVMVPVGACFVTWIAVFWSSEKVLSCSAIGLVSGNEPKKRSRKRASSGRKRSVYLSLILNNFATDIGRETVTVIIIFVCCFLIGLGTSIKLGHAGSLNHQVNDIFRYDLQFSMAENISEADKEKVQKVIEPYESIPLCYLQAVLQSEAGQTLTVVYVVEDVERFREFYAIEDIKGRDVEVPDDGLMVTFEMIDKNNLKDGTDVTIITDNLKMADVKVNGHFMLHVGKASIMTFDYYRKVFGTEPVVDTYMVKVGDGDVEALADEIMSISGITDIGRSDDVLREKAGMSRLYTIVVVIVIVFSIMLSFMILLNLSNILVSHRMKELLTMRVNGFRNSEVIGYLAREILVTTSMGIILGLLIGIPVTTAIIPRLESNGFMFLRQVFVPAWILGVGCNALFSIIINSLSFRKINKVPLTDITKY